MEATIITQAEYWKLLEKSLSFQRLPKGEQARIKQVTGNDMLSYVRLFEEESEILAKAYGDLIDETDLIVREFKIEVVKEKKNQLSKVEDKQRSQEEVNAENLLKNL